MLLEKEINIEKLPQHVAIIMDGNGRWAKARGQIRLFGHKAGVQAVKRILQVAGKLGIKYLTVYAFSTENWNRPKEEVSGLMSILLMAVESELKELHASNVKLNVIGEIEKLPKKVKQKIDEAIKLTKNNSGITFNVAISYSGRWEIINAAKRIAEDVKNNNLEIDKIDEELFPSYLATGNMPDPELLIRTSGELRVSNYLLYQIAYSEFYFTDVFWPDFSEEEFYKALISYQNREIRRGQISAETK